MNPWNWANILSSIRIIATIPLLMLLLNDTAVSYFWAFWFYAVVAITDLLDGQLARKYGWVSNLGIFLDLTADKIYTAGILICLVATNLLAPWAAIIILVREFVVTGLRSLAAAEGVVIPSGRWGKLKMIVTILALGWIMVRANLDRAGWFNAIDLGGGLTWLSHLSSIVLWLAVLLTIMSGVEYIWAAREIFRQPPRQNQD
ncbi:CDP-diacylglycerol--glycerol-3-phosphate 3-phosphatidyltransferase [Herpetosiphon llansteffanensis]|uniref:CDP-diacylglycerol--glycerol-3-phosphate 3-phosphatidyltransferase n=1 Tax=Herpetosiphon llansteffanensis TaxID=2094568 RepID=UPI0013DFFF66|nr:CDP-diacylglycerol--glycerol-3-phosphate 3-phosphatidyltransferase [Herpetosiphon llansteffanensis]